VNKRPLTELRATFAICFQTANSCTRWRYNFKGLSQDGGLADFSKSLPASLFNKYLSNELQRPISLDNTFKGWNGDDKKIPGAKIRRTVIFKEKTISPFTVRK
jgi:hypothetical protein